MHGRKGCRRSPSSFWAVEIPRDFARSEPIQKRERLAAVLRGTSTRQLELGYLTRQEFRSDLSDGTATATLRKGKSDFEKSFKDKCRKVGLNTSKTSP